MRKVLFLPDLRRVLILIGLEQAWNSYVLIGTDVIEVEEM